MDGMSTTTDRTASEIISDEVTSWPGVRAAWGERGELSFRVGKREVGHLHGDHALHLGLPRELKAQLAADGRVVDHPVFPGHPKMAARRIADQADVRDVLTILRLSYEHVAARYGLPDER